MRSPFSLSRTSKAGNSKAKRPKARWKTTKQPEIPSVQPQRNYLDDDSDDDSDDEEQNVTTNDSSRISISTGSSNSIRDKLSEYEQWKAHRIAPSEGCQSSCSDGKETVAAFGDVVTEVFDLINEVAFPEVMDIANEAKEKEIPSLTKGGSYKEDDDSVFLGSIAYDESKKAKDFLGFIGALKPTGNKHIINTPVAPSALLEPDGIPLNLLSDCSSIVETNSVEEKEEEKEANVEANVDEPNVVETNVDEPNIDETETRDDNENKKNEYEYDAVIDDDSSIEDFGSKRSAMQSRDPTKEAPDRYSIIGGSVSDDSSSGDVPKATEADWSSSSNPKHNKEEDYQKYIENVVNREKTNVNTILPATQDGLPTNPILPFTLRSAERIKSAIAQSFKRVEPKYSKPPSVGGLEKSDLLPIVESNDDEEQSSDDEDKYEDRYEIEAQSSEESDLSTKVEIIPEVEIEEQAETENNVEVLEGVKLEDQQIEMKEDEIDNTNGVGEEDYCSSAVSGSIYSSDDDDRTYISYTASDDSFLEFEERSFTSHTRYSLGIEDQSVTYSIGVKDSLLDESDAPKSDESSYESSALRYTLSDESSEEGRDLEDVKRKVSVAESLLEDDEEESSGTKERSKFVEPSQFCSVYDNLYPADSLFSFTTQDESLFNFSNSNDLESPSSILGDRSVEEAPSHLTDKSNVEANDIEDTPTDSDRLDFVEDETGEEQQHEERDGVQDEQGEEEDRTVTNYAVDTEDNEGDNTNSNQPREVGTEERDTIDENKAGEQGEEELRTVTNDAVDTEDNQGGNTNSNQTREVDAEERDGIDENKADKEVPMEGEPVVEEKEVSQTSKSLVSSAYGNSGRATDTPKFQRSLPARKYNQMQDKPLANAYLKAISERGRGENMSMDESSNSNRSRSSADSTEITNATNKNAITVVSDLNPGTKRRSYSRVRAFNQHRQNILKLQHKAE